MSPTVIMINLAWFTDSSKCGQLMQFQEGFAIGIVANDFWAREDKGINPSQVSFWLLLTEKTVWWFLQTAEFFLACLQSNNFQVKLLCIKEVIVQFFYGAIILPDWDPWLRMESQFFTVTCIRYPLGVKKDGWKLKCCFQYSENRKYLIWFK